ncbi:MAG: MJ0042-type zinc finger domain-containing protein [Isosphaeraceae bacterium]
MLVCDACRTRFIISSNQPGVSRDSVKSNGMRSPISTSRPVFPSGNR